MTRPNVPALEAIVRAHAAGCRSMTDYATVLGWSIHTTRARLTRCRRAGLIPASRARIPASLDDLEAIARRLEDPAWGVRLALAEQELRDAQEAEAYAATTADLRPGTAADVALIHAQRRTRRARASLEDIKR